MAEAHGNRIIEPSDYNYTVNSILVFQVTPEVTPALRPIQQVRCETRAFAVEKERLPNRLKFACVTLAKAFNAWAVTGAAFIATGHLALLLGLHRRS